MTNEHWMQLYLQAWAIRESKADFFARWSFFYRGRVILTWVDPIPAHVNEKML